MAKFFGVSPQTIQSAQLMSLEERERRNVRYQPNTRREKLSLETIKIIKEFWHDCTFPLPWEKTVVWKGKKGKRIKVIFLLKILFICLFFQSFFLVLLLRKNKTTFSFLSLPSFYFLFLFLFLSLFLFYFFLLFSYFLFRSNYLTMLSMIATQESSPLLKRKRV